MSEEVEVVDATFPEIEVVYYCHHSLYIYAEYESVGEALRSIEVAEDYGEQSTVGVYVDGEPVIWRGYVTADPPTVEQAKTMRELYASATRTSDRSS